MKKKNLFRRTYRLGTLCTLSGVLVLAACTKDATAELSADGPALRFDVGLSGSWTPGVSAASERSDTLAGACLEVYALRGPAPADTLFLHASVADGIAAPHPDAKTDRPQTRATPVGTDTFYDSFGALAYVYSGAWSDALTPDYMYNVEITKTSGWTATDYNWPGRGKKIRFFAYAPYGAEGAVLSARQTAGAPTITYTTPSAVADQKDLVVAAPAEMDGASAPDKTAALTFRHALTAVRFTAGDDMMAGRITKVTLKNVYGKAVYDMGTELWSGFTSSSSFTQTLSKEVDGTPDQEITPEEANRVGYEFAERFLKGRHAFFVATHTDKAHIHNHIYYNSTSLDCTRKFRDFIGSGRAVRRLSDRICLENDLSVIANPKLHSKGRFLHYGAWLGAERQPSYKEQLRLAINEALTKHPADFDAFLRLMEASGFTVKHGRGGTISFLVPGQERATRLRASTLGDGYDPEDIKAVIAGERPIPEQPVSVSAAPRRVNLIVDIQERLRSGKGAAYARWAKVYNLKQMAAALQFMQEQNITEYDQLSTKAEDAVARFHTLTEQLRQTETDLSHTSELMGAVVQYAKTRPVFDGYKAAKYSRKYLAEHEAELADYRAAKAAMGELLGGEKLPKMAELKEKRRQLAARKKALYADYRSAQEEMRQAVAVKANIDHLLGVTDGQRKKEQER